MLLALLLPAADGLALSRYEQRAAYKKALDHLTAGRMGDFGALRKRLDDYPLKPYLDYYELQSQLSSATPDAVMGFRRRNAELPVSDIVYSRWLKSLGSQKRWEVFLQYYEPSSDAELRCYHLRALLGTGTRDAALDQVPELWLSSQSQPKVCDPLFEIWIDNDRLTESMVWDRLSMALEANSTTLARYLQRFFVTPHVKSWAQTYYNVHVTPSTITQVSRFTTDDRYSRAVIGHGIRRLATRDAESAQSAWLKYQDSHRFPAEDAESIEAALAVGLARSGRFPDHADAPESLPAEGLSEAALALQRWADLSFWIERLPAAERESRRWQYWLARSVDETTLDSKRAELTFVALAAERDYYGFLAAERIGHPVSLNHQPSAATQTEIKQFSNLPAVQRATELYAVGDLVNARREWYRLLPTLSVREKATAARLADQIGWTSQGIRTANDAPDLRDDLDLRFPMPYTDEFQRVSHITTVPDTFLLAIARQESLFDPLARSSANARGLMQLIAPTAERVAQRVGITEPTASDLYYPALNIELGGHYLADLLIRYGARRPLAAAAYNAGEHRVDRWISGVSGQPMDVWIETIPFRETRNYVKNVMAFAKVYGYRRGSPRPMFEAHETRLP
ncbi:MAG: transglycosylase SLT domain-containing protein [Pseudomonadales bacterium]